METFGKISKENDGFKVVFERVYDDPVQKVWDAITKPEELKYWFTDIELDFRPGGKMTIRFRDKDKTASYGEVVSIDAPHRFVWTWEGELAVWELEAVDKNKTRLTFTYSKMAEAYGIKAPAGFHSLLDALAARLNGSEKTTAFGATEDDPEQHELVVRYSAAFYDAFPNAIDHKPVIIEQLLSHPPERVWRALTDKEEMKKWYFDLDDFRAEEGFTFSFAGQGSKGEQYIHHCKVTDVIPPKKLQYSWQYENLAGYSLVTFDLIPEAKQTRLRVTHHGLHTFPQINEDFGWNSFNAGWTELITKLLPAYLDK